MAMQIPEQVSFTRLFTKMTTICDTKSLIAMTQFNCDASFIIFQIDNCSNSTAKKMYLPYRRKQCYISVEYWIN